jgi:hypothetical protein
VGPQDPKGVSRDMARDLTSVAGELATLRGPQETPETVEGAKEGSSRPGLLRERLRRAQSPGTGGSGGSGDSPYHHSSS